jgi:site-specific DNA-methyltransferase (adenine-specific)
MSVEMPTVAAVLAGADSWACVQSDAVEFLNSLPDDSVDLLFTSPPYELARTYGIGERMVGGEAWVAWMVDVVRAAAPKVKGLIAVNCEGQTQDYSYSGVPFLLFADLKRAGFNMRKPCVYERDGVPGSGGPDWLKNRWEPIVCVTRRGRLPWSDNTAMGRPPKYHSGGAASYRAADGTRVGVRHTKRRADGIERQVYIQPDIANPGNVIKCNVGGDRLGHALAHDNEAPFPLELPEFFVKSFCPPDGVVCDPFSGSGTTIHAAVANGRRGVGCDIRESQVELVRRRLGTVTLPLFAS